MTRKPRKISYSFQVTEPGDVANPALSRTSGLTFWVAPPTGGGTCPAVTVDVTSLSVGAIGANTLSANLANPADSVASNSTWTAAATKYLSASTVANYVIRSLCACRDQEVTTWTRQGYVYLRLDNAASGNAIYFFHNGETANGTLEVGIVTSLTEASYPGGTYYPLYSNTNCTGTIPGYTLANTDGQAFTFGVSGFDIYAKYNGTEFMRFKEYRQMNGGQVAIKSQTGFGFRTITVSPLSSAFLYSNYAAGQLDLRDWNVRSIQTTGSISSGSGSLTLAAAQDFKIGDWVIVEIGAEAGAGLRGTVGVGGQWPTLSYATSGAMAGSTTNPVNTFAWVTGTGDVYQWTGAVWISSFAKTYYVTKAIPSSLHGRITAISSNGLTLTLDSNAVATATNANVYLDNQPFINYLTADQGTAPGFYSNLRPITPTNETVIIPTGSYAASGLIILMAQQAWTIKGTGQSNATLFCPKGVYSLGFDTRTAFNSHTYSDFTLSGNWKLNGFGVASSNWTYIPGGLLPSGLMPPNQDLDNTPNCITQTSIPSGLMYPPGIWINTNDNTTVRDVTINNVSQKAVGVNFGNNVSAYRCTNNQTDPMQDYIQWQFQWANTVGGQCVDCTINSCYLVPGFEGFVCNNHQFIRPVSNNAAFSQNNSQNWVIEDAIITVSSGTITPAWSAHNSMVQITTAIGSSNVAAGGSINNPTCTIQGYISTNNDIPCGINIGAGCPNITISSGSHRAPNYLSPGVVAPGGPEAIVSEGDFTSVDHFIAHCATLASTIGPTTYLNANIGLMPGSSGSVTNSCASVIVADHVSGNSSICSS